MVPHLRVGLGAALRHLLEDATGGERDPLRNRVCQEALPFCWIGGPEIVSCGAQLLGQRRALRALRRDLWRAG
jgi:hypothetical protein